MKTCKLRVEKKTEQSSGRRQCWNPLYYGKQVKTFVSTAESRLIHVGAPSVVPDISLV